MAGAAVLPLAMTAVGTVVSSVGSLAEGEATAAAAKAGGKDAARVATWQAAQLRQNAGQERAAAQREAIEERRRARLVMSRARALAGASGAGVSDPTITGILADLGTEGEMNAQTALWEGEEAARGLEAQAAGAEYEGALAKSAGAFRARSARRAGMFNAVGSLLDGGSDFYTKYQVLNDLKEPGFSPESAWLRNYNLDRGL